MKPASATPMKRRNYSFLALIVVVYSVIGYYFFMNNITLQLKTNRMLLTSLPLIWLGMVLAISFLEAPVKFTAPTLSRQVALDVGRTVFVALNKVEIVLLFGHLLALQLFTSNFTTPFFKSLLDMKEMPFVALVSKADQVSISVFILTAILMLEVLWLQPALDDRAIQIIKNTTPKKSSTHLLYVLLEVFKVLTLGYLSYVVQMQ